MRLFLLSVCAGLLLPGAAAASGVINPGKGAKAESMAGAWIAQGDDLSVMDHNPAQLVRQRDYMVELHYTAYVFHASFDPDPVPGIGEGETATNVADVVNHIPNLYANFPVGEQVNIGVGLFTPVGPRHTYASSGAQRYQVRQAQLQLVWPTLAVAWQPIEELAVSASLDVAYAAVTQNIGIGLLPGFYSLDGYVHIEGDTAPIPRAKVGLLYAPMDGVSIGLVDAHGIDLEIEGELTAHVPQVGFDGVRESVTARQRYPTEARLAIGWQRDPWRAELATRYYRWSEYEAQEIIIASGELGGIPIGDLTVPKGYRDAFAFQVGGGYRLAEVHEVRAGYMFDQQAARPERVSIQDFDAPKHALALGYGIDFLERYQANLGFNQFFYHAQDVDSSEVEAISVLGDAPALNDGVYDWNVQTIAVSVNARF
jgi:long-subunit fatty acid transport protein